MDQSNFHKFRDEFERLILHGNVPFNGKHTQVLQQINHQFLPVGVKIYGSRTTLMYWCLEPLLGLNGKNAIESFFLCEFDEVYGEMIAQADGVYL